MMQYGCLPYVHVHVRTTRVVNSTLNPMEAVREVFSGGKGQGGKIPLTKAVPPPPCLNRW